MSTRGMSLIGVLFVLFVFGVVQISNRDPEKIRAEVKQQKIIATQKEAEKVVLDLKFVKDMRMNPPICYAYSESGSGNYGPRLTYVPCAPIPANLFVEVQ